MKYRSSVNNFY